MKAIITFWAVAGVLALLAQALWKLTPIALEPWTQNQMTTFQIAIYLAWIVINAYAEGYRGFHKAFSPRVVGRAAHLGENPKWYAILAPLYAMCLFSATRVRLIVSWILVAAIVLVVALVRMMPQPWRGIIDGGVVVGLALGSLSILWFYVRSLAGKGPVVDLGLTPSNPSAPDSP